MYQVPLTRHRDAVSTQGAATRSKGCVKKRNQPLKNMKTGILWLAGWLIEKLGNNIREW
jgi:hypothetical protein